MKKFYRNTSHENSTVPFAFAHFCGFFGLGGACLGHRGCAHGGGEARREWLLVMASWVI